MDLFEKFMNFFMLQLIKKMISLSLEITDIYVQFS
jgi:hypothetical protein